MSERPEGAETVGIRRKRGKKGDIIAAVMWGLCERGGTEVEVKRN